MNKGTTLIIVLILGLCQGCNSTREDNNAIFISHSIVNIEDNMIARGGSMLWLKKELIGIEFAFDTCFYRISNGDRLFSRFGIKGQGPDELLHPVSLQYLNEETIGVYDLQLRVFNELAASEEKSRISKVKTVSFDSPTFRVLKTAHNQYVGIGAYKDGMLALFDSLGKKTNFFFEYPHKDRDEKSIKNQLRAMAYQGKLVSNPSKTKCVYASSVGDIIHFYEMNNNSIDVIKKIEKVYPQYITEERNGGIGAPLSKENKVGYVSVYTTEKYVYLLFSGKTIQEYITANKMENGDLVFVFNWLGEKVKQFKLDIPCLHFCVNNEDNKIYGIAEKPDPCLISFDLPSGWICNQ